MKNIIFAILIIGSLSACESDVLNKKPLDEIDEELVWSNVDLARLFINDIYGSMPDTWDRFLDLSTDIGEGGHAWLSSNVYNNGEINPQNSPYSDVWGNIYRNIRSINTFLHNSSQLEGDPEAIEYLMGEAYFLRAYYYSNVFMLFGPIPIIEIPQSLEDDIFPAKNTFDECVDFLIGDLNTAASMLPEEWDEGDIGRATSGAANSLKSRILLYAASKLNNPENNREKWQKVADACLEVIESGVYSLYPDYYQLFITDNNSEVIFDKQYAYSIRNNGIDYMNNPQGFSGAYGMLRPTQELIDRYEMANGLAINENTSGYNPADPYKNRDPRFYKTILYNGDTWRGKTIETFTDGLNGPGKYDEYSTANSMTGYYAKKFLNETNQIAYGLEKAEENWIIIRYAEVLLNYAEAALALGKEEEARQVLNMIRSRAGMPDIPASETGEKLYNRYINERIIELCFENIYFFDVRRWKVAEEWLSHPVHKMNITRNSDNTFSYHVAEMEERIWRNSFYLMPIPQSEIDKNPNLKQNQGYSGS
jgi:hypothetical protein